MDTSAHLAASSSGVSGVIDAVQHRLAVLGFADLKVRRLGRGLDEVAGRIDLEQAHALARDLAAEDQRHVEVHARLLAAKRRRARSTRRMAAPSTRAASNMLVAFQMVMRLVVLVVLDASPPAGSRAPIWRDAEVTGRQQAP